MNEYELARFEAIIANDISTIVDVQHDLFAVFKQAIKEETDKVKDKFAQAAVRFETDQRLRHYIQFHQQAIIRLEGHLLQHADVSKLNKSSNELDKGLLCRYLYTALEELLAFVTLHFPKYFDPDMWIPERARIILIHRIKETFETMNNKLMEMDIGHELISIALHPLTEFIDSTSSNNLTYRKLIYLKELQDALFEFLPRTHKNPTISLQWVLFYLNYNTIRYFNYITRQISDDVNATEDLRDKMNKLSLLQKHVHQHAVKPHVAFNPTWPSTRQQLSEWISQEIGYLDTRLSLDLNLTNQNETPGNTSKIKIDLSVAQVAYLVRVFIEVGILHVQNISVLLRHITKVFHTKRSDSVTIVSIQSKYYKPESSTKKAVRDLLLRLVKFIDNSEPLP